MNQPRILFLLLVVGVTSCTNTVPMPMPMPSKASKTSTTPTTSTTTTTTAGQALVTDVDLEEVSVDSMQHVLEYPNVSPPGLIPVNVDGGAIPDAITTSYIQAQGQLLDPESFAAAYGVGGLPFPDGQHTYVTDAAITVSSVIDGHSVRSEALGYLFMDKRPLVAMLDAFAAAAGVNIGYVRVETSVDGGAGTSCTRVAYLSKVNDGAPAWVFSGCEYLGDNLDGLRAVQVTRTGTFIEPLLVPPASLAILEPQLDPLIAATGGRLSGWSYTFSVPRDHGSVTLLTEATVSFPQVVDLVVLQVTLATALPGFTSTMLGDEVLFTNGPLSWIAGASSATLRVASRVTL